MQNSGFCEKTGMLSRKNCWVKTAEIMPWSLIEEVYAQNMCQDNGRGAIPARVAYGAIFVKEHEDLTDEETVTAVAENPYIQYFLGLKEFTDQPLFDPSMMVRFRKRLMTMMTETIHHHKQASPTRTRQRISSSVIRRTAEKARKSYLSPAKSKKWTA